jgi:hypothetical protein
MLIDFDFAGEKNGWSFRRNIFNALYQLRPVHTWHDEVRQNQVHASFGEAVEGLLSIGKREHAIATSFQQNFTNGERLFIVVNTEDGSFRFHLHVPASAKLAAQKLEKLSVNNQPERDES